MARDGTMNIVNTGWPATLKTTACLLSTPCLVALCRGYASLHAHCTTYDHVHTAEPPFMDSPSSELLSIPEPYTAKQVIIVSSHCRIIKFIQEWLFSVLFMEYRGFNIMSMKHSFCPVRSIRYRAGCCIIDQKFYNVHANHFKGASNSSH